MRLVSAAEAQKLDKEACDDWGLPPFALVEAAGRACAQKLARSLSLKTPQRVAVLAGSGNNAADALVLLRALILDGLQTVEASAVFVKKKTDVKTEGRTPALAPASSSGIPEIRPYSEALKSLSALGVPFHSWEETAFLSSFDIIIDGLSGTGLKGPLRPSEAELVRAVNLLSKKPAMAQGPIVVSVDLPSGLYDTWKPEEPLLRADFTLAIEPCKESLYLPHARSSCGAILFVQGIFPPKLLSSYGSSLLLDFAEASALLEAVPPDAYKNQRGSLEIRAGALGTSGAANLAAQGAQAAGAGLIRLVVDEALYPLLATGSGGIMVARSKDYSALSSSFDAALLGPGWGRAPERAKDFSYFAGAEAAGKALVLDADALKLAKSHVFAGRAILTPHPLELARFLDIDKKDLLENPNLFLIPAAKKINATIVLKGHVTRIASNDGRLALVDGMQPVLAMGGSGDLFAGFVAALAARSLRSSQDGGQSFDPLAIAVAAASLLVEAAKAARDEYGFCDPLDIAHKAAKLAGLAWLKD